MEYAIIWILVIVAFVLLLMWRSERKSTALYRNLAGKIEKAKYEDANGWADICKAVNQKLNLANARLAADKPMTELGRKRAASMAKAEAKRKASRAEKAKTKAK